MTVTMWVIVGICAAVSAVVIAAIWRDINEIDAEMERRRKGG